MEALDLLQQDYTGFAEGNQEMMEALQKALTAGSGVDAGLPYTGGRAMTPESLDTTLVNVLWSQEEAKFFKELKKNPVKSPVHQWTKRTEVGATDGAWVAEGGDSIEADQTLARAYVVMKYLQTLRKVTLQATLTNMIEDATTSEKIAGTLWIIRQVERILFTGDKDIIAQEPDGLDALISTNVLDMRGASADASGFEDKILEGARRIRGNYGVPTHLFTSLAICEDIQKMLRDRLRVGGGTQLPAAVIEEYPTPFGRPKIIDDVFIAEGATGVASLLTADRPSQPTIGAITRQAASGGRTSEFDAGDEGSYYYQVGAVNQYGMSQLSAAVQVTGVIAGDEIPLVLTDGASHGTGFFVFRSKKDAAAGTDCRYAWKIAWSGADPTIYCTNADLPGCSSTYLLNLNATYDAVEWEQFLPMMRFPLYPTNAAVYPFLMLLFGALGLKKEEQMTRIKNIAPATLGWF